MAFSEDVDARIAAVRSDSGRGASDLAREALDLLRWIAEQGELDRLPQAAASLAAARPAMAAIKNVVNRAMGDPAALSSREAAIDACRHARELLDYAARVVAEHAAALIPEAALLVTCSYSSAVVQACALADGTRRLRVLALESRVGETAYGELMATALRRQGTACEIVADEGMADALESATLVLVGADRVLPSGSLVNGIPSLALAQAAHNETPFYATCESFKLDAERSMEPGFDLVPAGLVTGYVTEHGVVAPGEAWAVHQRA